MLPNSVTSIGDNAFYGCSSLTSVTIYAPSLEDYDSYPFYDNSANQKIYVFSDCVDTYKTGWGTPYIEAITLTANEGATGEYWTTYYNDMADAKAPHDTQVFKASLDGTMLTLTEIADGIITKGQGVVLKSASASVLPLYSASGSTADYSDNSLMGTMTSIANPDNAYVLNKKESNGVGFYRLSASGEIGVNKAYLTYSGADAREFFGFGEGETTSIQKALANDKEAGAWYSLDGRRLGGKPAEKGLYIHNGRKEVLK